MPEKSPERSTPRGDWLTGLCWAWCAVTLIGFDHMLTSVGRSGETALVALAPIISGTFAWVRTFR